MTAEVANPVTVEQRIRACSDQIHKGVRICDEAYRNFLDAERVHDHEFARAYMDHVGPAHERRYAAELATLASREARDIADAGYRYADRRARAYESELRAWQSVGASVRTMYGAAGVGER